MSKIHHMTPPVHRPHSSIDLRAGKPQMAKRLGWLERMYRRLFVDRRANVAQLRLDRARRYG